MRGDGGSPRKGTADGGGRRLQANGETWGLKVGATLGRGGELEWTRGTRGGGWEQGVSVAFGVVQSPALRVCTRSANLGPRFR